MVEHFAWMKWLGGLWKAIVDRLVFWISGRKPKLYVHFEPGVSLWCIAKSGDTEYMQVVFLANLTHDDPKNALIITDAYPVGTATQVRAMSEFKIPSGSMVKQHLATIVGPIVGEKGKAWTGKIVLVDQFLRKYKTRKVTFKWVGPNP